MEFKGACWGGDLTALILGWCSGGSLADVLKTRDLEWNDPLLRLATDIARGMRFLHGRKYYDEVKGEQQSTVLHRDLKVGRRYSRSCSTLIGKILSDFPPNQPFILSSSLSLPNDKSPRTASSRNF